MYDGDLILFKQKIAEAVIVSSQFQMLLTLNFVKSLDCMAVLYVKLCILCSYIVQFPLYQFPLDDIYGISRPCVEETAVHAFEGKGPVVIC